SVINLLHASMGKDEEHIVERVIEYRNGLIVGRAIKSLYEGENIGTVLIRTNERFFSAIYEEIDLGTGADLFIIDQNGVIVSSRTNTIPFKKPYSEQALINGLLEQDKTGNKVFTIDINDHPHLVTFANLESADWYVVATIPYAYLNYEAGLIQKKIILLGLGCFCLAVFLSIFFTKSIVSPLHDLIKAMNQVKQGNLCFNVPDNSKDEIAVVTHHFNAMVKEIKHLMKDIKQKESQKRKAELMALQAQINPHFLSNLLNTARLLADAQNAGNVASLLGSVINLLHASMGKDEELITVSKELDYLRNYLNIQEYRYYQKFQVTFALEEEILDCKIPKFLLQPILENAIIHGIGPKRGQGQIEIKGYLYEDKLNFSITDDGVGMSEETIDKILESKNASSDRFSGIGIKNVQERIKLFFGDKYGLCLESRPHHFTTVEMSLPIIK
ncbi:MAG: sensor histidine kinase, partial [Firmicutes bacterium]|nr:sensor histidine kinase [Bacillota bacterium]